MQLEKIDLHGIKHEDVRRMVISKIELLWGASCELEIVTGRSTRMKGIVIKVLEEYGLFFNIGRMTNTNDGCIITWLE